MNNKKLDYLSQIYDECEGLVTNIDMAISDADDGENHTAEEGRTAAVEFIDETIDRFQKLRVEILNSSYAAFCSNNNIKRS